MKVALALLSFVLAGPLQADPSRASIEALTVDGKKVRLFENGRWEFVDPALAADAQKRAADFPENKLRPVDAQGGLLGVGRTVMPGDKDYNRGSLNPKLR